MMNSYSAEHQKHKRNLPLFTLLMILLITLLVHFVFLFLFKPIHYTARPANSGTRYTVICKPEDLSGKEDPWHLQYWLKYMEPESFVKPSDTTGFSMVHRIQSQEFLTPKQLPTDLFSRAAGIQKQERISPIRDFSDFQTHIYLPVILPGNGKTVETAWKHQVYPVWTDSRGRILSGLLSENEDAKRILQKNKASDATVLKLIFPSPGLPPEVRILRSCGNRELDMLGQRQLLLYAAERKLQKETMFHVAWSRLSADGLQRKGAK